jgi:hypothetical protein
MIVSPYVTPGSILSPSGETPFDHTSIIKTVLDNFNPGPNREYLNDREKAAPNVIDGLDFSLSNNPVGEPSL